MRASALARRGEIMTAHAPTSTVPTADSADNVIAADVIGNKTDTVAGDSLVALAKKIAAGGAVATYPVLAAGATVTAGAANTYGALVELAAAGAVTVDSRLASVCIRTPSAAQTGKILLVHTTGVPVSLCEVDYEVATDAGGLMQINLAGMGGVIPSGANIGAQIKTTAGAQTVDLSVGFMAAI
jgi:hypothetical protein